MHTLAEPVQNKTILCIGFTWPEPSSTAAGNRMLQLLDFFLKRDYGVTFASTAAETERSLDVGAMGVEKVHIKLNDSGFDSFVKDLNPEIVVFDRFLTEEQFGWRVSECVPAALRILNTEDLHSLRQTRQYCFKRNIPFEIDDWLRSDITKREIASIYRCELSLIISSYEMQLLSDTLKIDRNLLLHLPFMLDTLDEKKIQSWPSFEDRNGFICIGNGKHAPNVDAIIWLKTQIWPLIRKELPMADIYIYGAYLPQHIQQMHNAREGFHIMNWAENADTVLRNARVNLAPLRFGAGIKGKVSDAMRAGTPTVTTAIGAEGMHNDYPFSGYIANTSDDIAQKAILLYRDTEVWFAGQSNGVAIINTLYDKLVLQQEFEKTIEVLQADIQNHRTRNFIGGMLHQHTTASTKYMGKWIEAKNRKV